MVEQSSSDSHSKNRTYEKKFKVGTLDHKEQCCEGLLLKYLNFFKSHSAYCVTSSQVMGNEFKLKMLIV